MHAVVRIRHTRFPLIGEESGPRFGKAPRPLTGAPADPQQVALPKGPLGHRYTPHVLPSYSVVPEISLPAGDDYGYPTSDEISEEGFGFFRDTWWIGRARVSDARETIEFERDVVTALDALAEGDEEFDVFARAVENLEPEGDGALGLTGTPVEELVQPYVGDYSPLRGLEIGVAGLTYALSAVGFRTAASCRAHGANGWTNCPIVLFGAHKWRAVLLAELAVEAGCGIGQDRDMLTVYAPSIRNLMSLAEAVLAKRASFRSKPRVPGRSMLRTAETPYQATLGL